MHRRCFLLAAVSASSALADDRTDALDAVAPLASALSHGDADSFLAQLPADMPGRGKLRENLAALIAQAEVTSSVEVIETGKGTAELDWYMQIRSRATRMVLERRRGTVAIRYRKRRLEFLGPDSFFAPASVGP